VPALEQIMAAAAAAQNVCVAAHALGLGCLWRTGAPAYDGELKEALGFGHDDNIVGFLYLGAIAVPGRPRELDPAPIVRRLA